MISIARVPQALSARGTCRSTPSPLCRTCKETRPLGVNAPTQACSPDGCAASHESRIKTCPTTWPPSAASCWRQAPPLPIAGPSAKARWPWWNFIRRRAAAVVRRRINGCPAWAMRRRRAARLSGSGFVYTPQVMLNGRDFRGWSQQAFEAALDRLAAQPEDGSLTLAARFAGGGVEASLSVRGPAGARVVLVRYENGLASQVGAGENSGRHLTHDFVVRDWLEVGTVDTDGHLASRPSLPARSDIQPARSGLAALMEDAASGRIIQAVALPYCAPPD